MASKVNALETECRSYGGELKEKCDSEGCIVLALKNYYEGSSICCGIECEGGEIIEEVVESKITWDDLKEEGFVEEKGDSKFIRLFIGGKIYPVKNFDEQRQRVVINDDGEKTYHLKRDDAKVITLTRVVVSDKV